MIDDLDKSVEELLKRELPPSLVGQVAISFAAPDSEFPPASVTLPAVDLFLYDIRENLELRQPGWVIERRDDGTAMKQLRPVRVDCSYLVTAWSSEGSTTRALDEHRILSEVMLVLVRHPMLPDAVLQGRLKGQDPPTSALQPGRLQSVGELWQALGGKPKAALNYTVTVGITPQTPIETERPVIQKELKLAGEIEAVR
jgi:hypothetical protein